MVTASKPIRTARKPAGAARWRRAATLSDLEPDGRATVHVDGRTLVLWRSEGGIYALDNRCPHMGFPLDRGTCRDGILTCHWHSARFDLRTGGTFDPFADDVEVYPVELRGDTIWVDTARRRDPKAYYRARLRDGLEQDVRLVLAKSAVALLGDGGDPREPFRIGLEFGVRNRRMGWGQGLTMHTCLANILPFLDAEDRPRALFHGLDAISRETAGAAPRFTQTPLPGAAPGIPTLTRWLRQFLAVRDDDGAERALVSAVRSGASHVQLAGMLFAAATDYRYLTIGHALDFTNKAFEALDLVGWDDPALVELVLGSVVRGIAQGARQEESNAWRHPIDLVAILDAAFAALPAARAAGRSIVGSWRDQATLGQLLLLDDPQRNADVLLQAIRDGASAVELAGAVAYAAALRIARFHTSNEFGDWDTTLHTFTFANAVHMGLRRLAADPSSPGGTEAATDGVADATAALLRGVFDAAISVYLDRFLNVPAAPIPMPAADTTPPDTILRRFLPLLDRQQQVNEAGELVAHYLVNGGDENLLLATLGKALLREDRDFHSIQTVETAFRQYGLLRGTPEATHVLIAAARYLAAHAPTPRAQGQTYSIALRLHRGDHIYEG